MAATYDYNDWTVLSDGLQGCFTCDQALKIARRQAAERGEPVVLDDDDGTWIVRPDGDCEEVEITTTTLGELMAECEWIYDSDADETDDGPHEEGDHYDVSDYFPGLGWGTPCSREQGLERLRAAYLGPDAWGVGLDIPER